MDDWTYPYPEVDPPDTQSALLDQDWRAIHDRPVSAQRQAEAARRAAELEQAEVTEVIGDQLAASDVPPPFAAPAPTSLTY